MSYVSIKSLQVDFIQKKHKITVLQSVNLALAQGKIGVIIGPSGCGKSTLLNVLSGLNLDYRGQVLIDKNPPHRTRETALILQDYGLLPWKTVWDNVCLGLQIRKVPKKDIITKTEKILKRLGLLTLAKRYPTQLSGGQRQRVAIARSLVLEPKLLLMDEPFSSLDALTREEMQNLLLQIWKETNLTILLITHNIEEAVFLGQKIFIMSPCPGTIIQEVNNEIAGDYDLRGKMGFLEMCNYLRSFFQRREIKCNY
ncbi:MAG: NitT/TauT family transport system ATP-binding protein [Clostridia bacterium]|jgi:NitT/TauT family transport system ATP-binding protein|nr:transporter ATP-binding protein [Clostridiales bacterium]MDK2985384.1 NitT/TauT family transport system ATP-binding protein [Clostridia bacterium]